MIALTLADQNWAPVPNLAPMDLVAEYRGKPVRLLSLRTDSPPKRIVILLDTSASFRDDASPNKWKLAHSLALDLASRLWPGTSLALLIFNDRIQDRVDFSQAPTAVSDKLKSISDDREYLKSKVRGRTALWDSMIAALALFGNPTFTDALYVITDGGDNSSRAQLKDVRQQLARRGVRAYVSLVLGPAGYRSRTPEEIQGPKDLAELTQASGGALFGPILVDESGRFSFAVPYTVDEKLEFSQALRDFYQTILTGQLLEIELPDDVVKWGELKLAFSKERQQQFRNAQLSYTRDLAPCTETKN